DERKYRVQRRARHGPHSVEARHAGAAAQHGQRDHARPDGQPGCGYSAGLSQKLCARGDVSSIPGVTVNERVAIVGTAQSWMKTPWHDLGLHIRSLNDAYRMPGFQRADAWYDLHPLDKFYHPESNQVFAHQIPPGHYCRPKTHIEWLSQQQIPVWLHPEYARQHPAAATWKHARAFPKADIEAHFGRYFASSPGWMMGQALMEGVKELHIYGIHLATEQEYVEQRPNFEMLCGALLGRGKQRQAVRDGL